MKTEREEFYFALIFHTKSTLGTCGYIKFNMVHFVLVVCQLATGYHSNSFLENNPIFRIKQLATKAHFPITLVAICTVVLPQVHGRP